MSSGLELSVVTLRLDAADQFVQILRVCATLTAVLDSPDIIVVRQELEDIEVKVSAEVWIIACMSDRLQVVHGRFSIVTPRVRATIRFCRRSNRPVIDL
jgi:hypothetical protein